MLAVFGTKLRKTGIRKVEPNHDAGLFQRSDHYSFHEVGIVAGAQPDVMREYRGFPHIVVAVNGIDSINNRDSQVVLVLLGFPIALVLAWALEMTPEGIRVTPPAEPAGPVLHGTP